MTIFLFYIVLILLITYIYAGYRGAPWVPTKSKDLERILKLADIKPGQIIYDLGCGDGRILMAAADKGAIARGFELSLIPYFLAQLRRLFHKNKANIKISFKDAWIVNLGEADIVYFFLMPKIYSDLKTKLENELKPGAKVIAYVWPIDGWKALEINQKEKYPTIYLYQR